MKFNVKVESFEGLSLGKKWNQVLREQQSVGEHGRVGILAAV